MMNQAAWILLGLLVLGCGKSVPRRIENANLGIAATFPAEARLYKYEEDTPFGRMEWFDTACWPSSRMEESFRVAVGNLPPGKRGGETPAAVLRTFQAWLERRYGTLEVTPMAGSGIHYKGKGPNGIALEGVVVVRRGRIHHAQGMVRKQDDPRLRSLIDGFVVAP